MNRNGVGASLVAGAIGALIGVVVTSVLDLRVHAGSVTITGAGRYVLPALAGAFLACLEYQYLLRMWRTTPASIRMYTDKPLPGLLIVIIVLWLAGHAIGDRGPYWLPITIQIVYGLVSIVFGVILVVRGVAHYRRMRDTRRRAQD